VDSLIFMPTATTTQTAATRPKRGLNDPVDYRPEADYSIVRIIACRIAWLTKTTSWTNDPCKRGRWTDRSAAYSLAQACRGLLVIGCGLVDMEDGLTQ
jgi:hypothetical protein